MKVINYPPFQTNRRHWLQFPHHNPCTRSGQKQTQVQAEVGCRGIRRSASLRGGCGFGRDTHSRCKAAQEECQSGGYVSLQQWLRYTG